MIPIYKKMLFTNAKITFSQLFTRLGLVQPYKSVFTPTKSVFFLGFILNSLNMTVSLPTHKKLKIQKRCADLLQKRKVTVQELTGVI